MHSPGTNLFSLTGFLNLKKILSLEFYANGSNSFLKKYIDLVLLFYICLVLIHTFIEKLLFVYRLLFYYFVGGFLFSFSVDANGTYQQSSELEEVEGEVIGQGGKSYSNF